MTRSPTGTFLNGAAGPLATLSWLPPRDEPRFVVVHVAAAGEEMNKSRRIVAVQSRAIAAAGGAALVLDRRGTGDSFGEHGDATWDGWREDVVTACAWMRSRFDRPLVLWGLRLGGVLAAQLVAQRSVDARALILWQPIGGRAFFNQWLRLESAQRLTSDAGAEEAPRWRQRLDAGERVDVAGYDLHPQLVAGAETADLAAMTLECPVIWRESTISETPSPSPAATKIARQWSAHTEVDLAAVTGPSFWAAQELEQAPALIESTTAALRTLAARLESPT